MKKGVDYIGVTCVFYCHDGRRNILLHKRSKNCRDEVGRWDCGGGALELGETWEEAIRREVREEYCINPLSIRFAAANNVIRTNRKEKTHWIAILFAVHIDPKKVRIGEPVKMDAIGWFPFNKLPSPLHSMFRTHFDMVKNSGAFDE